MYIYCHNSIYIELNTLALICYACIIPMYGYYSFTCAFTYWIIGKHIGFISGFFTISHDGFVSASFEHLIRVNHFIQKLSQWGYELKS